MLASPFVPPAAAASAVPAPAAALARALVGPGGQPPVGQERPRERLLRLGGGALSSAELVAIVLGSGHRGVSAQAMGAALVGRFGLGELASASLEELGGVPGIGPAKALQIKAAIELGRRSLAPPEGVPPRIHGPADVFRLLGPEMAHLEQEHLRVLMLNIKHEVTAVHEVYKGSLSASPVRVAEVFREAIRRNAAAVILVHNHPSGDPAPSAADAQVTRQLVEAGRLLDLAVLDHVVIGLRGFSSLRERGLGF